MHRFDFSEYSRVYVPIFIKPQNGHLMSRIEFKVDTGADNTTISKIRLIRLGYSMDWVRQNVIVFKEEHRPTTASGERVNAGNFQLPLINILGYEGKFWPFQIAVDEDKDFSNLLGRDLLTGFNYHFDNDNDVFSIEMAKTFKPRFKFLPGQEIHEMVSS